LKKVIPILLMIIFFLFQGGKIVLYLECRMSSTPACDCVKILGDSKQGTEAVLNHKHLAEEFELLTNYHDSYILIISSKYPAFESFVAAGTSPDIFHPPACVI